MRRIHVIIYDESPVVVEGIQAIVSQVNIVQRVSVVSNFEELETVFQRDACYVVMLNPIYIQQQQHQYNQLKNRLDCIRWVGIIYAHFPAAVLARLDSTIDIYENAETIASKLQKWVEIDGESSMHHSRDALTDREIDVLKLLAEGNSNKEIADKLNISTNTVITHRKNISQKTGIKSVSGLTIFAVVQNLISLDDF